MHFSAMGLYHGLGVTVFGNVHGLNREQQWQILRSGHDANICSSSSVGFSLHRCLLLSPHVATPAASVVCWSNDVKHKSAIGGSKESERNSF